MAGPTFGDRFNQPISAALSARGYRIGSDSASIRDLNYKAFVVCHDENILVDAWLPDTISVDVTANYDAPFEQGLGGDSDVAKVAKTAGVTLTTQALSVQVWQGGSYIQFSLPFIFQAQDSGADDVMKPIKDLMRLMMPKEPTPGGLLQAPGPRLDPAKALTGENVKAIAGGIGEAIKNGATTLASAALGVVTGGAAGGSVESTVNGLIASANQVATPISNAIVNSVVNNISLYVGQFQYFPCVVITDVSPTYDVVLGTDGNPVRASVVVQFKTYYIPTQADIETMFPSAPSGGGGIGGNGYAGVAANVLTNAKSRN